MTYPSDASGAFFFDRDWWQFRLVLQFLREGPSGLPSAKPMLKQLFREAAFWRLPSLQDAVRHKFQVEAARDMPAVGPTIADAVAAQKEWEANATRALHASVSASSLLRPHAGTARLDAMAATHPTWTDPVYGGTYDLASTAALARQTLGRGAYGAPVDRVGIPATYGGMMGAGMGGTARPMAYMPPMGVYPTASPAAPAAALGPTPTPYRRAGWL